MRTRHACARRRLRVSADSVQVSSGAYLLHHRERSEGDPEAGELRHLDCLFASRFAMTIFSTMIPPNPIPL